jgi:hypothetical protein
MAIYAVFSLESDDVGPQHRVILDKKRSSGCSAYRAIDIEIFVRHAWGRDARFKASPHRAPIKSDHLRQQADRFVDRSHNASREAIVDDFWNRAASKAENRRSARHRFDHDEPKWFGPIDWKEQRQRIAEEFRFFAIIDLADIFHAGPVEQWRDFFSKIGLVHLVDLGGDFQRQALAIAIALSGRFSREMRPRKAT